MEARTTTYPQEGQLLVSISDMSMMKDIKKAISMLKGVTKVKTQRPKAASKREQSQACLSAAEREQAHPEGKIRLYDPETGEYINDETIKLIEDVHSGKEPVYHADSVDDMFQKILGYVPGKV